MIVEDEAISALVMKEELSAVGYDICGPVSTGEDAVRTAEREKPDVMLIDINLIGKMNGIDAAAQIRRFSSAHIIFLTGYSTKDICKIAADVNPSGFLDKPVVVDDVQRLIERLFESD